MVQLFFTVQPLENYLRQKNQEKVRKVYISPYCRLALVPPNFMKFGVRGQVTDVIRCVKFLVNRFRGYGVLTPQSCHFPMTWYVALATVYALPCDTVKTRKAFCRVHTSTSNGHTDQ